MKFNAEIVDDVSGLFCSFISLLLQNIKHAHCHRSYFLILFAHFKTSKCMI